MAFNFSRGKRNEQVSPLNKLALQIKEQSQNPSYNSAFGNKVVGSAIASLESATLAEFEETKRSVEEVYTSLESLTNRNHEFSSVYGELPSHSLEAAAYIAAASGNLLAWQKAQANAVAPEGVASMGMESLYNLNGGLPLNISPRTQMIAKESFDEKTLTELMHYSIVFNTMASRQDEFNALFFKPLTITPDQVGYTTSVRVEKVWFGNEHTPDGKPREIVKQNLVDAIWDETILDANGTEIIPFVQEEGVNKNTDRFIDKKYLKEYPTRMLDNVEIKTAPLKVNMQHDLLGLSSHPALIANGLMNQRDSLDSSVVLSNIYIKVGEQLVKYNTTRLMSSHAFKSVEGDFRQMTMNFDNSAFLVSKDTKAVDGTEVALFKQAVDAGYEFRLRFKMVGDLTVEHGYLSLSPLPIEIVKVRKDLKDIAIDDATFKPLVAGLKLGEEVPAVSIIGYDIEARRTNYDLRTSGRFLDSQMYTEQTMIPLRSPISINKPVIGGEPTEPTVESLIVAAQIQANNDGVKTILNHAEQLRQTTSKKDYVYETDRHGLAGIGRHFVVPFFAEENWDLRRMVSNPDSKNRLQDIQGSVVTRTNALVGRMLQETRYIPIVTQMTGGNPGELLVAIGTDYRLPQYFVTQGDERLFGGNVSYKIASTANRHMAGKVVLTVTRKSAEAGPDPFSYGTFVWTPELMTSATLDRGAQTYIQHMVQPRYLHIVNLPILAIINVEGIDEVTAESSIAVRNVPGVAGDVPAPAAKPVAPAGGTAGKPAAPSNGG